MGELKWYVLRVISGQEKKVKSYLENEIERLNWGVYSLRCLYHLRRYMKCGEARSGCEKEISFPGYVLISADLSHGEAYHSVNNIPGVIGFLGNNGTGSTRKIRCLCVNLR
jgi:transcription termination/antitermination protein NusG